MAGVNVASGGGGRRTVDSEINMVPMIDLLMCLICFLLITAVWSTMARLNADAQVPGPPGPVVSEPVRKLHVSVEPDSFRLTWRLGSAVESSLDVPRKASEGTVVRFPELAERVTAEWEARGEHRDPGDRRLDQAVLHCDNRTAYKEIVAVIDAVYAARREFPGSNGKKYPAMNVELAMNER